MLVENLIQMLRKPSNKYSINTVIKHYEHIAQVDHFNLSILTILKATQCSKAVGLDNLSRGFLKDEQVFYPSLLVIYVISQLPLKNFLVLEK